MLLVMFGVLLILGMFMEQISIMLLTVPIFFPTGHQSRIRADLVCSHHAAGAGNQLHHAALRTAALCDEGCRATGHDDARHLPGGDPVHRLLIAARGAADRVPEPCTVATLTRLGRYQSPPMQVYLVSR
jgi:hypothetical protein